MLRYPYAKTYELKRLSLGVAEFDATAFGALTISNAITVTVYALCIFATHHCVHFVRLRATSTVLRSQCAEQMFYREWLLGFEQRMFRTRRLS